MTVLGLRSSEARQLKSALKDLSERRKLIDSRKGLFGLASGRRRAGTAAEARPAFHRTGHRDQAVTGKLIGHREGFGFVVPDQPLRETGRDIFIPAAVMKDAMHGDRVEVQVFRSRSRPDAPGEARFEGVILRVLERAQQTVVGEFHYGPRYNIVQPFDHRISGEIVIPRGEENLAQAAKTRNRNRQFGGESEGASRQREEIRDLEGMMVDVEITRFPGGSSPARGRIIEVLGRRDDFGVDVEIMIRKYHL
ncbi:MAG: hypothetical protein ACRD10_03200, partial [Terriglobia bacterium]